MGRLPSRGSDQFIVRLPDGMRDRLKKLAEKNGRSMNAEIVARLEQTMPRHVAVIDLSNILETMPPEVYVKARRVELSIQADKQSQLLATTLKELRELSEGADMLEFRRLSEKIENASRNRDRPSKRRSPSKESEEE